MKETQHKVDQWIQEHGVRYFNELTNFTLLTEEVGELARYMSRVYGEQSFKKGEEQHLVKQKIEDEMADILFVIVTFIAILMWVAFSGWVAYSVLIFFIKTVLKDIKDEDRKN